MSNMDSDADESNNSDAEELENEDEKLDRLCIVARTILASNDVSDINVPGKLFHDLLWAQDELIYWHDSALKQLQDSHDYLKVTGTPFQLAMRAVRTKLTPEAATQRKQCYEEALSVLINKQANETELKDISMQWAPAQTKLWQPENKPKEKGPRRIADYPPLSTGEGVSQSMTFPIRAQAGTSVQAQQKTPADGESKKGLSDVQQALLKHQVDSLGNTGVSLREEMTKKHQYKKEQLLEEHFPEIDEIRKRGVSQKENFQAYKEVLRERAEALDAVQKLLTICGVTDLKKRQPQPNLSEDEWNPIFKPEVSTGVKRAHESSSSENSDTEESYASINKYANLTDDEKKAVGTDLEHSKHPAAIRWTGKPRFPEIEILHRVTSLLIYKDVQGEGDAARIVSAIFRKYEPEQGQYGCTYFKLVKKQIDDATKKKLLKLDVGEEIAFTPMKYPKSKSLKKAKTF